MRLERAKNLAAKFNLILLEDQQPHQRRHKPQYLVDDATPSAQVRLLPRGHWRVHRAVSQPPHKPRSLV